MNEEVKETYAPIPVSDEIIERVCETLERVTREVGKEKDMPEELIQAGVERNQQVFRVEAVKIATSVSNLAEEWLQDVKAHSSDVSLDLLAAALEDETTRYAPSTILIVSLQTFAQTVMSDVMRAPHLMMDSNAQHELTTELFSVWFDGLQKMLRVAGNIHAAQLAIIEEEKQEEQNRNADNDD